MSGSALDGPLWFLPRQKSIDQSRSKRVTPAYPVEDFQIFANRRLVEPALGVAHRSPAVQRCRSGGTQRGSDYFDRRKFLDHLLHHQLEVCWIQLRVVLVQSRNLESQRGGEVLLITEHHVHEWRETPVNFLRFGLSPDRLPQ